MKCGPCVRHRNNRHPDNYRACDLVAMRKTTNETLGKVVHIMTGMGSMLRLAYSVLQNIALRVSIISNYPDIEIDLRNVAERLNIMLCNIDRILRSGSFYRNIEFPECRLEDHIYSSSNKFRNVTSTDMINYVVNFVVYSRNNLEYLIGNINNIFLNI